MTGNSTLAACIIALCIRTGFAIPIVLGNGIEPVAGSGSFGASGRIFEYRVQGTPGLAFTASQSLGVDGLRLSYSFTATTALALAGASLYLDADIDQDANTWFNERGEAAVAAGGATSWEIDEPGFGVSYVGDIFTNYVNGTYDNAVFGGQPNLVEDVAMGLGFAFGDLLAGDLLLMEILLSESAIGPGWGTVLHQWDEDDGLAGDNLYFAGRFSIQRGIPPDPADPSAIPEPGTFTLLALGLMALVARSRFRS